MKTNLILLVLILALALSGCEEIAAPSAPSAQIYAEAIRAEQQLAAAASTAEVLRAQLTATTEARNWQATQQAGSITFTREAASAATTAVITQTAAMMAIRTTQQAAEFAATREVSAIRAEQTQTAILAETAMLALERARATNQVRAAAPWAVLALVAGLAAYAIMRHTRRPLVIPRDARGDAPIVSVGGLLVDVDRAAGPVVRVRPNRVAVPQLSAPNEQRDVLQRDQALDAIRAAAGNRRAANAAAGLISSPASQPGPELPECAPWQPMLNWRGRSALPLGQTADGQPLMLDPERTPHLLIAGTSGAGKTRSGLRPIAALALAAGWQVALINDAGSDFAPLADHPNLISTPSETPEQAAQVLEQIAAELDRRDQVLRDLGVSTWSRLPASEAQPRVLVVVDELVQLAWSAGHAVSERIWRAAIHITSKGRKAGVHLIAATTDPTNRTLGRPGLVVRDNCARLIFRVRDAHVSRALNAPGAENLSPAQFIADFDGRAVMGVAFHPSDEDLVSLLANRPAAALPAPGWGSAPVVVNLTDRIRELHAQGLSLNEIQRQVLGYTGGRAYQMVADAISTTGTASTDTVLTPQNSHAAG